RAIARPADAGRLAVAIADAAARQVVWTHLYANAIAEQDTDAEFAHLAAGIGQQLMAIIELDLELGVGQGVDNRPVHFDRVVLRQRRNSNRPVYVPSAQAGRR